ncbi:MAG: flippase-like domain-containing protein [Candidatus Nomurabacteria bacterium]|nr:flippase-like domain-containing protein [Candidatus Nomurabacteria bacterium]
MYKQKHLFGQLWRRIRRTSWRTKLNFLTFVLIIVILILARHELVEAWHLMGQVNLLILSLLIPIQFASYYASTEIFFTYLRARGQLQRTNRMQATAMSLELNFVNHVFPSGGISGMSYMVWRLRKLGVTAGQATMAQIMKYVIQMGTFMVLLSLALIWATLENRTANWVVVVTTIGITGLVFLVIFGGYLIGSQARMKSFAHWFSRTVNSIVKKFTFGRRTEVLKLERAERFFLDFHSDFMVLKNDKKLLARPVIWSFTFNILEILLFMVSFWALGVWVNPAALLIAYGAATLMGTFMLTPGGAGAYEALMIGVLTASGVPAGAAFAGVILARAILIVGTLASGFVVYQHALRKHGRPNLNKKISLRPDDEIERTEHG